jgi:hypothetical protein
MPARVVGAIVRRMGGYLRAAAGFVAVLAAAVGLVYLVVLASELFDGDSGPAHAAGGPPSGSIPTPNAPGFPSPPPGAVVFAREDGANVLALALVPGGRQLSLQASVVGPEGHGVAGLRVGFAVGTSAHGLIQARAAARGPGRYVAVVAVRAPRFVAVTLAGRSKRRFVFALPRPWPPTDATALVSRSGRVWRNLRTLVSHERLASDRRHVIHTRYRMAAPDRFAYQIAGGPAAIILGSRRWDRSSPTAPWRRSSQQPPLRQPSPFWRSVRDARGVSTPRLDGRRAWRITFFDPTTPAWFEVLLDKQTMRTLELWMVTTSHFMHDVYGPFDRPLRLRPPR